MCANLLEHIGRHLGGHILELWVTQLGDYLIVDYLLHTNTTSCQHYFLSPLRCIGTAVVPALLLLFRRRA